MTPESDTLKMLLLWLRENDFTVNRLKVGDMEFEGTDVSNFGSFTDPPVDNDPEKQDDPDDSGDFPDPDGPLDDRILYHSSGHDEPTSED